MKIFLILFNLVIVSLCCAAQSCGAEFNIFSSQQSIDDFIVENPDCNCIEGNVFIFGDDINDLSSFANIESVKGYVIVQDCPNITNLSSFSQLREVEDDFILDRCENIVSLFELESLISIDGKLSLVECYNLQDLGNLPAQAKVGGFELDDNRKIREIRGFKNIDTLSTLIVSGNDSLEVFTAFEDVIIISNDLTIGGRELYEIQTFDNLIEVNSLIYSMINEKPDGLVGFNALKKVKSNLQLAGVKYKFNGFQQVDTVGTLNISCVGINSFNAFTNLKYIGGAFSFTGLDQSAEGNLIGFELLEEIAFGCFITGNKVNEFFLMPNLEHIGLGDNSAQQIVTSNNYFENVNFYSNLISTGRILGLYTQGNPFLNDISGLDIILADSINDLRLSNNLNLSTCHTKLVCDYLALEPLRPSMITDNAEGCNSDEEILEQCATKPPDDTTLCPIASRPGMQIDRVDDDTYNIMYHYGVKRMYLRDVAYAELVELIVYHKVEKELHFNFDDFTLERYCNRAESIARGENYIMVLPTDPLLQYRVDRTLSEIDFFQNFVLTIGNGESVKL